MHSKICRLGPSIVALTMAFLSIHMTETGYGNDNKGFRLSPPPIIKGTHNKEVPLTLREMPIGETGKKFEDFLRQGGFEVKVFLFELSAKDSFWLNESSSMGNESREKLKAWLSDIFISEFMIDERKGYIETNPSLLSSFLGGANRKELIEGSNLLANLIGDLQKPHEETSRIDRSFYETSLKICPFSQRLFSFILIDPMPMADPDTKNYMVVIETIYEE